MMVETRSEVYPLLDIGKAISTSEAKLSSSFFKLHWTVVHGSLLCIILLALSCVET
jgi:hypothetical protein